MLPDDEIPSSCCGKYDKGSDQVGDCSEDELKSKPGCGNAFNKFFKGELPNLNHPFQVTTGTIFFFVAVLVICLAWIHRLHAIEKEKSRRGGHVYMPSNIQTVFSVTSTQPVAEETHDNPTFVDTENVESTPDAVSTAKAATSFR